MGLWGEHVLPRLVDRALSEPPVQELRARACADLAGTVLEIGFGSGTSLPHLPAAVERLLVVDPSGTALGMAGRRIAEFGRPVERVGEDAGRLDLPAASVDHVLSVATLCTVPDPQAALAEARRVLRPGGALHLLEHGVAPDRGVRRWQRRLEPVQRLVAGGCHLTRPVVDLVRGAGFEVQVLEARYLPVGPRPFTWFTLARATPAPQPAPPRPPVTAPAA